MPRPRLHDRDDLLDAAERLVTSGDVHGLTLRGLAGAAGVSNGSIYHAFFSKDDLAARLWLRAAARLGAIRAEALDTFTASGVPEPTESADAPSSSASTGVE
ncbi:MAG TPA: helix-turn-helix domain-containing protein, partial [Acidimicrobiales bacterium]|nr:helix-turn-helix domain-containing protein [Acidimicrobiales bacterium]